MEERVIWTAPAENAERSMPVGGYNMGANVWFEGSRLYVYFGRDDSYDENGTLLKSGRLAVDFPKSGCTLSRQIFDVEKGCVEIELCVEGAPVFITVWCSQFQSGMSPRLRTEAGHGIACRVSCENWRTRKRYLPDDGTRWQCASLSRCTLDVYQYPDVMQPESEGIFFWHENSEDLVIDKVLRQQGLEKYRLLARDTLKAAVFGGFISGKGWKTRREKETGSYLGRDCETAVMETLLEKEAVLTVYLAHQQGKGVEGLKEELRGRQKQFDAERDFEETCRWWKERWEDSYIKMHSEDGKADEIGRNYRLFRYQLLCNSRGVYPTKFNGGLFTVDPVCHALDGEGKEDTCSEKWKVSAVRGQTLAKYDADWRLWGSSSFTAQNQRLVYWPMLMNGDFECMKPQFDFYSKTLDLAKAMVREYWGHGGAAFGEHLEIFGLIAGFAYGWTDPVTGRRPNLWSDPTEYAVPYVRYYYTTALEFCYMILKYQEYSGREIEEYLPFITESVRFFSEHYKMKHRQAALQEFDEQGHLVFFPSTAAETYKDALNPTDLIVGLKSVLRLLLQLDSEKLGEEEKEEFAAILKTIPPIPYRECQGHRCIAPAESFTGIMNVEIPQLYPVFPYHRFGVGHEDLETAVNTWRFGVEHEDQKDIISWHQDNIFTACLGLEEEAKELNYQKMKSAQGRFPTFWGPGHDWIPDHNWGGSGMLGIQNMLIQETEGEIYLLPAWPADWEVEARLHLEGQAVLTFSYRENKVRVLSYDAPGRRKELKLWKKDGSCPSLKMA